MNKLEGGLKNSKEDIKEGNVEKVFEDFGSEENKELSPVVSKNKFRKYAFFIITGGVMLLTTLQTLAQEGGQLTEQQKIDLQIKKLEEQKSQLLSKEAEKQRAERIKENNHLGLFKVDGLELGKAKIMIRCPCEQFGVYLNGKHLGDIYSEGESTFSREKLIKGIAGTLMVNGIHFETELLNISIIEGDITPEAEKILRSWGGYIDLINNILCINGTEKYKIEGKAIKVINKGEDSLLLTCENNDGTKSVMTCKNGEVIEISEIK